MFHHQNAEHAYKVKLPTKNLENPYEKHQINKMPFTVNLKGIILTTPDPNLLLSHFPPRNKIIILPPILNG